jgi:2-dehydropantoate 2-reductase
MRTAGASVGSALVVGAGAVGAVFGAALLKAGWRVTFRVRPENFIAYRRRGLRITAPDGDLHIDGAHFSAERVEAGTVDLVFLGTKMPDFEQAIHTLAADDDGTRLYVTVQNGLAAPEMTAALFGRARVLAGAAVVNAHRIADGLIVMQSPLRRLTLAPLAPDGAAVASQVAALLQEAGIDATMTASAERLLWEKFVGLEPLATTCALAEANLGAVRSNASSLRLLRGLYEEVFGVGAAAGAPLDEGLHQRRWEAYLKGPAAMQPSMAVDLAAGRPSELEWLTGAVVALARDHGVETPLHDLALAGLAPLAKPIHPPRLDPVQPEDLRIA